MKQVICQSGLQGWEAKLQDNYQTYELFAAYARTYGVHKRLGYRTPRAAWGANPTIQGSVLPSDFRKVE